MDTALIVFAAGTAASFVPMYWIASRLMGRRRVPQAASMRPATTRHDVAGRREFMDLLRQEAANRAIAVLREALVEVRLATHEAFGDRIALSPRTRQSLDETRRLIDSLFASGLREAFGRGIEALTTATSDSISTATATTSAAIAAFEQALAGAAGRPAIRAASRRRLWATIRDKGRGWMGARGIGATA